ncbi:MAG: DUF1127 domain-containing protein [Rhodobacteraceae bacterium]|nr:DUF1127 domain-containing protein [Paracoccaceae bacterium]
MTNITPNSSTISVWALAARVWRVVVNRRQINKLEDLSDAQLKDIGLTRSEVRQARKGNLLSDPSSVLTQLVSQKRQAWVINALSLQHAAASAHVSSPVLPTDEAGQSLAA